MSRIGLLLGAIYALVICICLALALSAGEDLKGRFVFLQAPIVFQAGAWQLLGLGPLLKNLSWLAANIVIAIPTFGLLYFAGWLWQRIASGNVERERVSGKRR